MKKLVLTLTATLACVAAFAQGKIAFVNDSLHLVYFDTDHNNLKPADASLAGQAAYNTPSNMPAGITLVADLYAGAASTSLALVSTTTFSPSAGKWVLANSILPNGLAGGTAAFFQVQIRDEAFATATASGNGGSYASFSAIFTTVPGSGTLYNSIVNHNSPALSTWANGTFPMDSQTGIAGALGVLDVRIIPEPSTFVLAGLGAAALLVFRRRK